MIPVLDDEGGPDGRPETGPVRVPRRVLEGIEAVRCSGLTNMLDRPRVANLAASMGFAEASRWVRRHRDLYTRAIFHEFEVEDDQRGEEE